SEGHGEVLERRRGGGDLATACGLPQRRRADGTLLAAARRPHDRPAHLQAPIRSIAYRPNLGSRPDVARHRPPSHNQTPVYLSGWRSPTCPPSFPDRPPRLLDQLKQAACFGLMARLLCGCDLRVTVALGAK